MGVGVFVNGSVVASVSYVAGEKTIVSPPLIILINAGDRITVRCTNGGDVTNGVVASLTFTTSGAIGEQGATGPKGEKGDTDGATGATGFQGSTGATGIRGLDGSTGPTGATGPRGSDGNSITLKGSFPDFATLNSTITSPAQGDFYITTDTGDGYVWNGSSWDNVGAIRGPEGSTGPQGPQGPAFSATQFKTKLTSDATINTGSISVFIQKSVIDTSTTFNNGGYSVSSSDITVPDDGIYQVTFNCFMNLPSTANVQRPSVGVQIALNGSEQGEIAAMGYIRDSAGHEETTVALTTLLDLTSGDTIGLMFARLANSGTVNLVGENSAIMIMRVG